MLRCADCEYEDGCSVRELAEDVTGCAGHGKRKANKTGAAYIDPSDDGFGALCNCAVRYCIGRESYMPGLVQHYIRPLLPELDKRTLVVMRKDIETAGYWGDERIDKPGWMKFLADIDAELKSRK